MFLFRCQVPRIFDPKPAKDLHTNPKPTPQLHSKTSPSTMFKLPTGTTVMKGSSINSGRSIYDPEDYVQEISCGIFNQLSRGLEQTSSEQPQCDLYCDEVLPTELNYFNLDCQSTLGKKRNREQFIDESPWKVDGLASGGELRATKMYVNV